MDLSSSCGVLHFWVHVVHINARYVPWYVRTYVHTYHPWNPQTRTTTETVLREAMQALVRVQAHMLARIVVEIRAADIAVELEP